MAKKTVNKEPNALKKSLEFAKRPNTTFTLGLVLMAFTLYIIISFLSFFLSGGADQSEIGAAAAATGEVVNSAGRGGAIVADYLVNDCFGWSSLLIIPLLVVVAIRLMDLRRPQLLKWFVSIAFGMVWGSLFFSFALGNVVTGFMNPGGAHGDFLVAVLALVLVLYHFLLFLISIHS